MKKRYTLLFMCLGMISISACFTTRIEFPKGSSAGYSSYRIYKHSSHHVPDFSNREDLANERIQQALKDQFNAHGLIESPEDAELIVAFLLLVQDTAVSTAISDYYINSGSAILSEAHRRMAKKNPAGGYEAGSLVVDVIDKQSGNLIYRDYASREILEYLTDTERERRLNEAVAEAVAAFFKP